MEQIHFYLILLGQKYITVEYIGINLRLYTLDQPTYMYIQTVDYKVSFVRSKNNVSNMISSSHRLEDNIGSGKTLVILLTLFETFSVNFNEKR